MTARVNIVAAVGSLLSLTALATMANAGKVSSSVKVHVSTTCTCITIIVSMSKQVRWYCNVLT